MNTAWIKTRQTKYAAYATTYILVIIAVLVVANFLANRYNKSLDATSNKRFTLSDQTKKVVGELKQDVMIQYFDKPSGMPSLCLKAPSPRPLFLSHSPVSSGSPAVSSRSRVSPSTTTG